MQGLSTTYSCEMTDIYAHPAAILLFTNMSVRVTFLNLEFSC
ncbi:hypothetical protein JOE65_001291 [Arthrobacter roseus]|nr:hypothetical protein [Arthrobacter roseus]